MGRGAAYQIRQSKRRPRTEVRWTDTQIIQARTHQSKNRRKTWKSRLLSRPRPRVAREIKKPRLPPLLSIPGKGPYWRRATIRRDQHRCRECGSKEDITVHHLKKRSDGGVNHPVNLVTLCQSCHNLTHRLFED